MLPIAEISAEAIISVIAAGSIAVAAGWVAVSSKMAKNRRDNAKAESDFWRDQRANIKAEIQPEIDAIRHACDMSRRAHEECEKDRMKTESDLRDARSRIEFLERTIGMTK